MAAGDAFVPFESKCHAGKESRCHQQAGRGRANFEIKFGARMWKGWPSFLNHYYIWVTPNPPLNFQRAGLDPAFIGPLYEHFDGFYLSADGGLNVTANGDIDDSTLIITNTQTDTFGFPPQTLTVITTGPNEHPDSISQPVLNGPGKTPDSDTHWGLDLDTPFGPVHYEANLGSPKTFMDIYTEAWGLAQTGVAGYGRQSGVFKNSGTDGAPLIRELQIGLTPPSVSAFPFPYYVTWSAPPIIRQGAPGQTVSGSGSLLDGAFWGVDVLVGGNVAGGYIVSYSSRTRNWTNLDFTHPLLVDVPVVMGSKVRNVSNAALATYENQPGIGIRKLFAVDVNYGGRETVFAPLYTDQKAYERYQVLFPGRSAASIGNPNQIWR